MSDTEDALIEAMQDCADGSGDLDLRVGFGEPGHRIQNRGDMYDTGAAWTDPGYSRCLMRAVATVIDAATQLTGELAGSALVWDGAALQSGLVDDLDDGDMSAWSTELTVGRGAAAESSALQLSVSTGASPASAVAYRSIVPYGMLTAWCRISQVGSLYSGSYANLALGYGALGEAVSFGVQSGTAAGIGAASLKLQLTPAGLAVPVSVGDLWVRLSYNRTHVTAWYSESASMPAEHEWTFFDTVQLEAPIAPTHLRLAVISTRQATFAFSKLRLRYG